MRFLGILFLLLLVGRIGLASATEDTTQSPAVYTLREVFTKGKITGNFRYFYMQTQNAGKLTDYYANALGGGLKFETKKFYGFQVGIGGFFIYNVYSSDFTHPDPHTGIFNRYEIGQFDITDAENRKDIDRLEYLYITYNIGKTFFRYGQQNINTPWINPQDGRMRPTGENGLWMESHDLKKFTFRAGWLNRVSPRGTVRWYRMSESIGMFAPGRDENGNRHPFPGNLTSAGVALLNVDYKPSDQLKIQFWNQAIVNIHNTSMLQADGKVELKPLRSLIWGLQYIRQDRLNQGGNIDPQLAYVRPGYQSNTIGLRLGIKNATSEINANYTHITGDGRLLSPREWGRDPLYTFLPRERNEGYGNVHALMMQWLNLNQKRSLQTRLAVGYYQLPPIEDFRLNKYAMPSYYHLHAGAKYSFHGFFEGLDAEFLILYKGNMNGQPLDQSLIINKVDMMQINFIVNYIY